MTPLFDSRLELNQYSGLKMSFMGSGDFDPNSIPGMDLWLDASYELIMYDTVLDSADTLAVINYLKTKWGI